MADKSAEPLDEIDIKTALEGRSVDWYLQSLVTICNKAGLEMGITLNVGGGIVSGTLIGGKKYFESFAKQFADAWPGDGKEEIQVALAKHAKIYTDPEAEQRDTPLPPPQYIHLANARFFHAGRPMPARGTLWRGKINAISGFSLGELSVD